MHREKQSLLKACGKILHAFAFFLVMVSVGCQYDPFAHEYCQEKPEIKELVGIYRVIENTARIPEEKKIWLRLFPNERYEAFSMRWLDEGGNIYGLQDEEIFKGTWRIETVGGGPGGEKYWGLYFSGSLERGQAVCHVSCKGDKKKLIIGFGDPDSGDALVLAR